MRKTCIVLASLLATGVCAQADLLAAGPNADAPEEVKQYGQLVGHWSCQGENLQPDGSWQKAPTKAEWSWYYVLDGYAVQDVWEPGTDAAPMGTNLRTYDKETGKWHMVWATQQQARFDEFTATFDDGKLVMFGERWSRPQFQAHDARITFFNMDESHFDWKYEASQPGADTWLERARLSCDRL